MRKGALDERLQPALLDRLVDDDPSQSSESRDGRTVTQHKLRAAVLRDLAWLFNAVRPSECVDWESAPSAQASVLNFGMPAFSGQGMSTLDIGDLERQIRQAIVSFEPRIDPTTVRVRALENDRIYSTHNQIQLEIQGTLWGRPAPFDILLRTDVDLETGQVQVKDLA